MTHPSYHDISSALLHIDFFNLDYFYLPIFQPEKRGFYTMYFYVVRKNGGDLLVDGGAETANAVDADKGDGRGVAAHGAARRLDDGGHAVVDRLADARGKDLAGGEGELVGDLLGELHTDLDLSAGHFGFMFASDCFFLKKGKKRMKEKI